MWSDTVSHIYWQRFLHHEKQSTLKHCDKCAFKHHCWPEGSWCPALCPTSQIPLLCFHFPLVNSWIAACAILLSSHFTQNTLPGQPSEGTHWRNSVNNIVTVQHLLSSCSPFWRKQFRKMLAHVQSVLSEIGDLFQQMVCLIIVII